MNYNKRIDLYKKNKLNEEERIQVEIDIEKQQAISNFLFEQEEQEHGIWENNEEENKIEKDRPENDFLKKINQSIRRKFIKMGVIISSVTVAIVLFILFLLPSIVDNFYYDPGRIVAEHTNQMSLDMAVYTELMIPSSRREHVVAEKNGYGSYDTTIIQTNSFNNMFTDVSGKLIRNKLKLYDTNLLKRPTGNIFGWFQMYADKSSVLSDSVKNQRKNYFWSAGNQKEATERLGYLEDNQKYIAYITLDKIMDYETFVEFADGQDDITAVWCAAVTSELSKDNMFLPQNIGFYCLFGSSTSLNWDRDRYPNLLLWDEQSINEQGMDAAVKIAKNEDAMKTHFVSMLKYMLDQDTFLSMVREEQKPLEDAVDYLEKNNLTIYGFSAVADKEALLRLNELDEVFGIDVRTLR